MRQYFTSLLSVLALLISFNGFSQVTVTSSDSVTCIHPCTNLHAHVIGDTPTDAGVAEDDVYSPAIPIGFTFVYYGISYTSCVLGANGSVDFNISDAGSSDPWTISAALAGNPSKYNNICGPWCDIDIFYTGTPIGTETYSTDGVAPNRKFVITWCGCSMFECSDQKTTTQIILYETTNVIEVHVAKKDICTTWNPSSPTGAGGRAIIGVEAPASMGGAAVVAPGRDWTPVWTALDEAWRFTPTLSGSGAATYTVTGIPYAPVPLESSAVYWYNASTGAYIGTGDSITVCPNTTTTYKAGALGCADTSFGYYTVVSNGTVTGTIASTNPSACGVCNGTITVGGLTPGLSDVINYTFNGAAQPPYTSTVASDGTITISGLCSGSYTNVTATQGLCSSAPLAAVLDTPILTVTVMATQNPSVCGYPDGTITLMGLYPNTYYSVVYDSAGIVMPAQTGTTDASGHFLMMGLYAGTYTNIVTTGGPCPTSVAGPATLVNPAPPVVTMDSALVKTCVNAPAQLGAHATPTGVLYYYTWSPATYLNNTTISNPVATATASGDVIYTVTVNPSPSVPACASTATVDLHVYGGISINPTDTFICKGQAGIFVTATGDAAFSYQWLPTEGIVNPTIASTIITPDTTTDYVLTATLAGCPDMHAYLHFAVEPMPDVFIGGNRFVCQFDTIHLNTTLGDPYYPDYSYQWVPATNLDHSNTATVVFSGSTSVMLYDTVRTLHGCKGVDSAYVTVNPSPDVSIPNMDFCPHDSMVLNPTAVIPSTYHWYPPFYLSDSMSATPMIHPLTTQVYTIVATTADGCKDTATFTATVHPAAVIFIPDSVVLYPGENYQFSPSTNCVTFNWFPPAGLNADNISNPLATPLVSTLYFVTGTTEYGCVAKDSTAIIMQDEAILATPNAFTPGNGTNTDFKVLLRGVANLNYFRVFNRWGNLLFETNNIELGWDGNFKGQPQPMGVYVYEVQAVSTSGEIFTKKGNITLLR